GQVAGKAWFEGHGSCMRMAPSGDIACDVVRLDDLLERFPPPRLVKMDIEGGEDDALAGASRLLSEVRPVWVVELLDRLVRRPVSGSGRRAIDSCGLVRTSTFQRTSLSVVRPISWPPRKGQRVKGSVCGTIGNCGPIDEQQGG
ncbi:MAG: FkbM family methyltransferase, partial [Candidatus Methanomethylicaceae archaeon]